MYPSAGNKYDPFFGRCVADHQRDGQFPFLDETVVDYLQRLPMTSKVRYIYVFIMKHCREKEPIAYIIKVSVKAIEI